MKPTLPDSADDGVDPVRRAALRRWLDDLAATTVLAPDAWESFEALRTGKSPRWRPPPRLLVGAAAALLLVLAVTTRLVQDGDDGRVRTVDESTTTTDETRGPSTTGTDEPADTTEVTDPADSARTPNSTTPTTTDRPSGAGSPQPDADATPAESQGRPAEGPFTTTPPSAAGRVQPVLTQAAGGGEYTVELVWQNDTMYFRRTDDVGSTVPDRPDPYGHVHAASWGSVDAPGCLASSGQAYAFPGDAQRAFTWGVVGGDIAAVEVVMDDGTRRYARIGARMAGGLRPWILERPLGRVDRIEGRNQDGEVVASITELIGDWGLSGC